MIPRTVAIVVALLAGAAPARAESPRSPRFGLHLGTGGGGWRIDGHPGWFTDTLARNPLELALAAEGDAWISRRTRAGARGSALYLRGGDSATHTSLLLGRLEAFARFHPRWNAGPYLHAGLGPAFLRYQAEVPGLASGSVTAWGGSVSVALGGYVTGDGAPEFRVEAEASAQRWLRATGGPDASVTLGGTLGVAW